jgi:cell fate regulator YaaT (PSP1 superfamily)
MPLVVGVRFNQASKIYYFDPEGTPNLETGDYVVVETARGQEVGKIVISPNEVPKNEIVGQLKSVVRRASAIDLTQMAYHRFRDREALERCKEKVEQHRLPMKVVRAEYNYDGSRLLFFFVAEKRVDFRRLVQDLARSFKARIELRQVGVRDEAKLMGGIARCGLQLCCSTWLTEFNPVSIKMAKQQDLPLSPMEISGLCGRLLCCLSYENQDYINAKSRLPKRGRVIDTPQGSGKVVQVNVVKDTVEVELDNQIRVEVSYQELVDMKKSPGHSQPTPTPREAKAQPSSQDQRQSRRSSKRRRKRRKRPKS